MFVKPRVGEREREGLCGCAGGVAGRLEDRMLVTPREDFVSYPRSYFRILFRTSK